MNNYWGEPDDDYDMPDWMKASTHQKNNQVKKNRQTLEQACAIALTKPAIHVIIEEPKINVE